MALQTCFADLGVVHAAVLGHSIGEVAAACGAGAISMEGALELAAA